MLERRIDLDHPVAAGFTKNVRREEARRAKREVHVARGTAEARAGGEDATIALLDAAAAPRTERKPRRARSRRAYSPAELAEKLREHVVIVLTKHTGSWTEAHTAEHRDAVGADESPWPVVLAPAGPRALRAGGWREEHRPALLALRRAVLVEVLEHGALGPRRPISRRVLASASVLCGDAVVFTEKDYRAGVLPGEALDRIGAGFDGLRKK